MLKASSLSMSFGLVFKGLGQEKVQFIKKEKIFVDRSTRYNYLGLNYQKKKWGKGNKINNIKLHTLMQKLGSFSCTATI